MIRISVRACLGSLLLCLILTGCVNISSSDVFLSSVSQQPTDAAPLTECNSEVSAQLSGEQGRGIESDNIRFINWNIYKGNLEGWLSDLEIYAEQHDVMTLQEAMLRDELTSLLSEHDFDWTLNIAFKLNGRASGVMNVATASPLYQCGFRVVEPIMRTPKTVLVSYYSLEGYDKPLLVANIHGINFSLGLGSYRNQLSQLHDALQHHDGPMILAGDFNSWSAGRMSEVEALVADLSLSSLQYKVNASTRIFGRAVDHVFYRGLDVVSHEVFEVTSSDHNPISVHFNLRADA
ncbi:MAG: endonuclease/exonuclease/phosphatase family protein [Pseudomonadota bacterium]